MYENTCEYSPIPSTITYHLAGGEWQEGYEPKTTYTSEEFVILPTEITKNGYTLTGWKDDDTGLVVTYINVGTEGDKSYTAQWEGISITCARGKYLKEGYTTCDTLCDEPNKYCEGGTYKYSETEEQGKEQCPEEYPLAETGADNRNKCYKACSEREGYVYVSGYEYMYENTCEYEPKTYHIFYELNGGEWPVGIELIEEFVVGVPLETALPTPKMLNKSFANWVDANGNEVETIDTDIPGDVYLYANWENGPCANNNYFVNGDCTACPANSSSNGGYVTECVCDDDYEMDIETGNCKPIVYTITYNGLNGANNPNPTTYTIEDIGKVIVAPDRRAGYSFSKWTRKGKTFTEIRAGLGNITLLANWNTQTIECEPGKYIIGGTDVCDTPCKDGDYCPGGIYYYDDNDVGNRKCPSPYTLSHNAISEEDCYAACLEDTNAISISGGIYPSGDNTCSYTYAIDYRLNGGEFIGDYPQEYTYNSDNIELPTPIKSGYEFKGWYLSEDYSGNAISEIDVSQYRETITLYAKWYKECPSGVRLYIGDGSTSVCLAEEADNLPALAIRVGNGTYYLNMVKNSGVSLNSETTKKLHVEYNGNTYNVYEATTTQ